MRKISTSVLIMALLIFITSQLLVYSKDILNAVLFSLDIWQKSIFPSLFPFFVLSSLLVEYGFVEFVGELFKPIMNYIFKCKGECAFVLIMSLISGFPSSAKYTKELYKKGIINEKEASKLLMFTHFSNPLFLLGTVSIIFLNNKEVGLFVLFFHYITNFIIGFLIRNYVPNQESNVKFNLKKAITSMHKKRISNNKSFGTILTNSLNEGINTLLFVLGVVTFFLIITTIIDKNIHVNTYHQSIINGIFEMTQGLKYISLLDIPLKFKATLSVMILSFGGFSVHVQMIGILSDTKISYLPFLMARLLHAAISSFLLFFTFDYLITLI